MTLIIKAETMFNAPIDYLNEVKTELQPLIDGIAHHNLYKSINSIEALRIMSEYHVYAVWDFMCLLKALQRNLTCVSIPWTPPLDALGAHLINEILTEEEGDIMKDGRYLSHFEIYLEAMEECHADTSKIRGLLDKLRDGIPLEAALNLVHVPEFAQKFVKTTFKIISSDAHEITAGFVFGREDITAKMFYPMLTRVDGLKEANKFAYYFKRHIELDEGSHAPKAYQLLMNLCGKCESKWQEAARIATIALKARIEFLDSILQAIKNRQP